MAEVPVEVLAGAVVVVLQVGLVVLFSIADEVTEGEPVVGGDEVDAGPRAPSVVIEKIAGSRDAGRQFRELSAVSTPEPPHGVAVAVVPLGPPGREAAKPIPALPDVPGFGDQLYLGKDRVLKQGVEKTGVAVEPSMFLAGEGRRQVEAEPVDMHLVDPISKGVGDQLQDPGMMEIE